MAKTFIDLGVQAKAGSLTNAEVNASAAIAYSKLNLTGAILNADLAGSIAYSKLSLTGAILNADLAGSIAYSKLSISDSIVNADINSAAAIAYSKLNLTGAILNADLAGSIAYSKLSLTGAILDADLAGSISDGKLSESYTKADGTRAFSGNQSMGSNKLTSLADGVDAGDAVNKGQLDDAVQGLSWKAAVEVSTTANITLSGEQTIDGILTSTSRVLVKNQTAPAENGIYVSAAGAWSRASDMNTAAETDGAAVFVRKGSVGADIGYTQTAEVVTLGTDAISWSQFTSGGGSDADTVDGLDSLQFMRSDASDTWTVSGGGTLTLGADASDVVNIAQGFSLGGVAVTSSAAELNILDGVTMTASQINAIGTRVDRETPAGDLDGVDVTYVLANSPTAGTEHVYLNGVLLDDGGEDYTLSGATITFVTAPQAGDKVRVSYRY